MDWLLGSEPRARKHVDLCYALARERAEQRQRPRVMMLKHIDLSGRWGNEVALKRSRLECGFPGVLYALIEYGSRWVLHCMGENLTDSDIVAPYEV